MPEPVADQIVFEDEYCRVWSLALEPGEATGWHKHELNYVYVVTAASPARTEYVGGEPEEQRDEVGATSKREPDEGHRLLNVGTRPYRNIVVELKQDPKAESAK
jgi:quercetin dioxygenase-like cupin family protein